MLEAAQPPAELVPIPIPPMDVVGLKHLDDLRREIATAFALPDEMVRTQRVNPFAVPRRETQLVDPFAVPRRAYNPVGPRKLRFIRWFLAADWPLHQVAHLFDVEPADIREAMAA